jgi:hypothetical protein
MVLLLCTGLIWAQPAPAPATPAVADPAQLENQARTLYVARAMRLRADQIPRILPLLGQAQDVLGQRQATLDSLWARGQQALAASNQSLMLGRAPDRAVQTAVADLAAARDRALADADRDFEKLGDQFLALLDAQQAAQVETLQQRQARLQAFDQYRPMADAAMAVTRYATGMRQLLGEEYDFLRQPMALRLAQQLVAPDAPRFMSVANSVLQILDAVRAMTDADFAKAEPRLPLDIARALGLPNPPALEIHLVNFNDLMFFLTNPQTASTLQIYKPEPAMEVAP